MLLHGIWYLFVCDYFPVFAVLVCIIYKKGQLLQSLGFNVQRKLAPLLHFFLSTQFPQIPRSPEVLLILRFEDIMQSYIKDSFAELYNDDGMTVMGRGLGMPLMFSKFVQYYATKGSRDQIVPQKLVLCINTGDHDKSVRDILISEGVEDHNLPEVINNEVNAAERADLYLLGGCYFITSRILIVDLLDNKLDASKITGLLIYNAHRISESSIESFIVRVFRERNRTGFIKAFSEDPEQLQGGFKIERLLRSLFLKKLFLWPRFRLEVAQALQRACQPEVVELSLPLTKHMLTIQNSVLVAMNTCLQELKKACPTLETSQWTLDNGLFHHFDSSIRSQLDPDWHRIAYRTKQIVSDLSVLRRLLDYLVRYDAFSFYYLLTKLHAASREQISPSLWLTSAAAEQVYRHAKARVYALLPASSPHKWQRLLGIQALIKEAKQALQLQQVLDPVLECPPKWNLLQEIVKEIKAEFIANSSESQQQDDKDEKKKAAGRVLLIVRDELALNQLKDLLLHGSRYVMDQRFRWFVAQQQRDISMKLTRAAKEQAVRLHKSNSRPSEQAAQSSSGAVGDMDWNDAAIQQILQENSDLPADTAPSSSSAGGNNNGFYGFLGLGLTEVQVRSLGEEQQLLLLQHRILKMVDPEVSQQAQYSVDEPIGLTVGGSKSVQVTTAAAGPVTGKKRARRPTVSNPLFVPAKRPRTSLQDTTTILFDTSTARGSSGGVSMRAVAVETEASQEQDEDEDDDAPSDNTRGAKHADDLQMMILTHAQLKDHYLTSLRETAPSHIILYDADVYIVRAIEAYQSTLNDLIKVYFFAYEGSTEEHRYAGALAKEKRAFESLIQTKEHMVISLPDHPHDVQQQQAADVSLIGDSRQKKNALTALQGKAIIVDVREFRSTLPSLVYSSQYCSQLIPRTLWVGDYVLSPEICVERKGISDLFQSFASGRLYNQCTAMSKHYKYPCLLIEFQADKSFSLVAAAELGADITASSIISKIVLLVQSFPNLRLLWSRSPAATVDIFRSITMHHDPVDEQKAVAAGAGTEQQDEEWALDERREAADSEDARQTAQNILLSLPGINVHNFREVMHQVENLSELSKLSEAQLVPMIGKSNAAKLAAFFRQRIL